MRFLVAALAALALAAPATAANVATAKMAEVGSWAAGRPITVHCENDAEAWRRLTTSRGFSADAQGFTLFAEPIVYIGPRSCLLLSATDARLALGLSTLLHEAYTHYGNGVRDNAIQECAARVLIYSALHDFYAVPWWSPEMRSYTALALDESLRLPAEYQNGCSRLVGYTGM